VDRARREGRHARQQQTNTPPITSLKAPRSLPLIWIQLAQTFTAGLSGGLDRGTFLSDEGADHASRQHPAHDVEVGGSAEQSKRVASTTVPPTKSPPRGTGFRRITFTAPAPVVAGTQYAIVAFTADPAEGAYEWGGSTPNALTRERLREWRARATSPRRTRGTREVDRGFVSISVQDLRHADAQTATCGKTTVGSASDALLSNIKRVNKCVLPATRKSAN